MPAGRGSAMESLKSTPSSRRAVLWNALHCGGGGQGECERERRLRVYEEAPGFRPDPRVRER